MRLIAKTRVYYPSGGGTEYKPGEAFETETDRDAEALVLVGLAEYPAKSIPPKKVVAAKPAVQVEPKPTVQIEPKADPIETKAIQSTDTARDLMTATGAYRRRDMRPEE